MTATTMISISTSLSSSAFFLPSKPLQRLQSFKNWKKLKKMKIGNQELICRRRGRGICRAELVQDAPFAAAIGACILTSLVFPISYRGPDGDEEEDVGGSGGAMDSTDARFAVMGIISVIPYFNWMSWVFAWLDSGKQRYLVYAVVYLLPYLRTNLSLSPGESWLPITSIFLCIIHVQLEASIKNGDLNGIQFFGEALKLFSPFMRREEDKFQSRGEFPDREEGRRNSSALNTRDEFEELRTLREKKLGDPRHLNENRDVDDNAEENKID